MRSLITIDVEGATSPEETHTTVNYKSVDKLDEFLSKIGFETTLFVTPDVMKSRTNLVNKWICEGHDIGLHIHPERMNGYESPYLSYYDLDSLRDIVRNGVSVFETKLNRQPKIFRAGRWEYSDGLLKVLSDEGFRIDASLSPIQENINHDPVIYNEPFRKNGIQEFPVTVYSNILIRLALRYYSLNCIPFDLSVFLTRLISVPGFYLITLRQVHTNLPYLLVVFHDFDLINQKVENRIISYLRFLTFHLPTNTLSKFKSDPL